MNVPRKIDRAIAIAHLEAVRDAATADGAGMFGTPNVELPESFETTVALSPDIAAGLRDLFRISPGMMCGQIYIYDPFDMSAEETAFTDLLDGGPARWQDFALLEQVPIFVERTDGTVWHSFAASFQGMSDLPMQLVAPDVLTFAAWIAMGPGYAEFTGVEDDWAAFLREHGFFGLEEPE
jgi:hypothetical protein